MPDGHSQVSVQFSVKDFKTLMDRIGKECRKVGVYDLSMLLKNADYITVSRGNGRYAASISLEWFDIRWDEEKFDCIRKLMDFLRYKSSGYIFKRIGEEEDDYSEERKNRAVNGIELCDRVEFVRNFDTYALDNIFNDVKSAYAAADDILAGKEVD